MVELKISILKPVIVVAVLGLACLAQAQNVKQLTLQQIYALPMSAVQDAVMAEDKTSCDQLISSRRLGGENPDGLTEAEFCAVQNYTSGHYSVNKPLWLTDSTGSGLTGTEWAYVRTLDAALAKIPNAPEMTVYRGTSQDVLALPKPGKTLRLKGYTSTSPTLDAAEAFLIDRLMIIKVKSGKDLKPYSNAGFEDEILLPRSTFVRVDRVEKKKMELFTENGPELRLIEIVHLTEISR